VTRRPALQRGVFLCLNCLAGATSREHLRIRQNEVSWPSITDAYRCSKWASRPGPAALYSGLMALPEPPQASRPLEAVTIALAAYGGLWPTSLVERGAEEALPPRPTERGLQGGRAARRRRSHRDPLARSPAAPARIPPPAPPVSPTGKGHGEALTPPGTKETVDRHLGAVPAKRAGRRGADAGARARNEHNLVPEVGNDCGWFRGRQCLGHNEARIFLARISQT
jgi:hypothetical protein